MTLRERKKQATREALREAALRLALERGPDNVRVDDIAAAAGVSPRTYNNYFSSREQAIVAAVVADRTAALASSLAPGNGRDFPEAVIDAIVGLYARPGRRHAEAMLMIRGSQALRASYTDTAATLEPALIEALTGRTPDPLSAESLAAAVAAAVKVALRHWLQTFDAPVSMPGFVIPSSALPDLIRTALAPLAPALRFDDGHRDTASTGG